MTHLKLQKLVFYAYGAALAFDLHGRLGPHTFEAWKHGPVSRDVWDAYKEHGSAVIPQAFQAGGDDAIGDEPLRDVLSDVMAIYGRLDAWSLRQQTHLERPWADARAQGRSTIDVTQLREHFVEKFRTPPISPPEYFLHAASFTLDGVPAATFSSMRAFADAIRARRGA